MSLEAFFTPPPQALAAPKLPPLAEVKAPVAEEVPIPSDNKFIDEKKPEMVKSAFKRTQKEIQIKIYIH